MYFNSEYMSTPTSDCKDIPSCFTSVIEHAFFNDCLEKLRELVRTKTSTRIVLITGPTGAGKTTARERFAAELEALAAPEIAIDPQMVPYGECAAKAPGPTAFSWKDNYIQMLRSLRHPFSDSPMLLEPEVTTTADKPVLKRISLKAAQRGSNDSLFRILQNTINHRQPKALIYDEAQHFLRVASATALEQQLEHLKYMADETKTLHVLFGTYELTKLVDLSSALIRRREVIHFPRYAYDANNPQTSLEPFAKVVAVFAKDLDDRCDVSLLEDVPNLYQGSVGCIGVLRDWLFRAFSKAKDSGRQITQEILSQTMLPASDRLALLEDALKGEAYFAERLLKENKYLISLGFIAPPPQPTDDNPCGKEKKRKRKPGERNPHNDPVGTDHLNPDNSQAA